MIFYNENFQPIEDPSPELGRFDEEYVTLNHEYFITVPEETHEEVIAEYPETGGKDVIFVVDVPEQGYWKTWVEETETVLEDFDASFLDENGADRTRPAKSTILLPRYYFYTKEELAELEKQKVEFEAEQKKQEALEKLLEELPEILCAMYEQMLEGGE